MVSEMSRWFNAEEEAASARMQQMMKLAEIREGQYREELEKNLYSKGRCTKGF
jgi:hypothetical protein